MKRKLKRGVGRPDADVIFAAKNPNGRKALASYIVGKFL